MAASLMTRTGLPKAFSRLKRVQPLPRFFGSVRMRPFLTGAGKPTETTSYFQSSSLPRSIPWSWRGVRPGPEVNLRRSSRENMALTLVRRYRRQEPFSCALALVTLRLDRDQFHAARGLQFGRCLARLARTFPKMQLCLGAGRALGWMQPHITAIGLQLTRFYLIIEETRQN